MTVDAMGSGEPAFPSLYDDFDIRSPVVNEKFNDVNRDLLEHCPVAHTRSRGEDGYWIINRAEDALRAGQSKVFSSEDGVSVGWTDLAAPEEVEDPLHTPLRLLMNPYLTRVAVERHRPAVQRIADRLIDAFIDAGEVDAISQYADLLAGEVFCTVVGGMPAQDMPMLHRDMHERLHGATLEDRVAAWERVCQYNDRYLQRRREEPPRGDLVDALIGWQFEGFESTDKAKCLAQLMEGGLGTTSSVLGEGLRFLATDSEARQRLLDEPSRLPPAIEEWLRTASSVFALARRVKEDTEIAGVTLKAGDRACINFAAANFDPRKFDDPMRIDIDRSPNPHVAFGIGRHRCIGSHLARLDLHVGFEAFLARIPQFALPEGFTPSYTTGGLHTMTSLRLNFDPATTRGPRAS